MDQDENGGGSRDEKPAKINREDYSPTAPLKVEIHNINLLYSALQATHLRYEGKQSVTTAKIRGTLELVCLRACMCNGPAFGWLPVDFRMETDPTY